MEEEEIENGLIRFDYFSLKTPDPVDESGSVQSGSPGWIEPQSNTGPKKHFSELWSDTSSEDELGLFGVDECPVSDKSIVKSDRGMVWWKEMFKWCCLNNNHVWSFSMAAALVGFVVLGRRLYNINKKNNKSPNLQLKVLLDDKKVVNHAARLNEAISIVKCVPILRPALPSPVMAMNQWSMMSLR